jgi:hypothetical protein
MSESPSVRRHRESSRCVSRHRTRRWGLFLAVLTVISTSCMAVVPQLPPGGTTRWEMEELEVVVTFLLFDPKDPAIALPKGLRFISLSEVDAPEFQDHLKKYPDRSDWRSRSSSSFDPRHGSLTGRRRHFLRMGV